MKKSIFILGGICLIVIFDVNGQGFLKNVTKSVSDEVLGKPKENPQTVQPEPACACDNAELIFEMSDKIILDYNEMNINSSADGSLFVQDRASGKSYIVKDGKTEGPFESGDPKIAQFEPPSQSNSDEDDTDIERFIRANKPYISRSGEKFLITFAGKKYGPYAQIMSFAVTKSREKFAAIIVENMIMTESQGKNMEEAMENAKNDQERMELAMQMAQQMQENMMKGGDPTSTSPKFVSNIPNATFDPMKSGLATLNGNVKYDEIVTMENGKVIDLQGKTLMTIKPELAYAENLFINSSNTKYATYQYGTLTFSDNKTLSELFNLRTVKVDGKIYLAYMYFSPKKNAIMQCKILF